MLFSNNWYKSIELEKNTVIPMLTISLHFSDVYGVMDSRRTWLVTWIEAIREIEERWSWTILCQFSFTFMWKEKNLMRDVASKEIKRNFRLIYHWINYCDSYNNRTRTHVFFPRNWRFMISKIEVIRIIFFSSWGKVLLRADKKPFRYKCWNISFVSSKL